MRSMSASAGAQQELASLEGGLVVSCQAPEPSPLHGPAFMSAMAQAAVRGGAAGIRADGPEDIAAIRRSVEVPILGILKVTVGAGSRFITPSSQAVRAVIAAGSRLVALDGTGRPRPGGESLAEVIAAIHDEGACALADVSTEEEGQAAAAAGADAVGTTLSGYTPYSPTQNGPDLTLVARLVRDLSVPIFAEGRIGSPEEARQALEMGATFVVVGTAITDPIAITRNFVECMRRGR